VATSLSTIAKELEKSIKCNFTLTLLGWQVVYHITDLEK
jgi:hypothetical protein